MYQLNGSLVFYLIRVHSLQLFPLLSEGFSLSLQLDSNHSESKTLFKHWLVSQLLVPADYALHINTLVIHEWRNGSGWAANETSATLANRAKFNTLRRTPDIHWKDLGDQDRETHGMYPDCMHSNDARHDQGNTWPTFEMLAERTASTEAALEDANVLGPPQSILWRSTPRHPSHLVWTLEAVMSQPRPPPRGMLNWNSWFIRLSTCPPDEHPHYHPMPDTSMPMDIDRTCRPETHSCYNCNDKGHLWWTAQASEATGSVSRIDWDRPQKLSGQSSSGSDGCTEVKNQGRGT